MRNICQALTLLLAMASPTLGSEVYCGIHCVYACSQMLDASSQLDFEELTQSQYVDSTEGSSAAGVLRAMEHVKLKSRFLGGLTIADLRFATCPIVLHVKSDITAPKFNHWIVFCGWRDDKISCIDPSHGAVELCVAELGCRWDGRGIVVGKQSRDVWLTYFLTILLRLTAISGGLILAIVFWHAFGRWFGKFSVYLGACLVCSWGGFALLSDSLFSGLLRDQTSVPLLVKSQTPLRLDELGLSEMRELVGNVDSDKVLLIDTRRYLDFEQGTIGKAISVPVDISPTALDSAMSKFNRKQPIVVFCQSSQCPYAEIVARRLSLLGFEDIRHFREGYSGWTTSLNN